MTKVIVVGAGIGGLAVSLVLSRVVDQVMLVERSVQPAEVGAALTLQANGMTVLDHLGVLPALEQVGSRIDQFVISNIQGRALLEARMPDFGGGIDHALAVRRTQLHRTLLDAVNAMGTITTMFGWAAVSADPSGTVAIHTSGEAPRATTLEADLVIGADGVGSSIRGTGGFVSAVSRGSTYLRAVVDGPAGLSFREFWTPLGSFGHVPLPDDATYMWAAVQAPALALAIERRDLPSLTAVWGSVLPLAGELLDRVGDFDDLLLNTVSRVDCRRWYEGRLVLLGDAAHAMAPNLGQGANSALTDAMLLADSIRTMPSVGAALQHYDRRRRRTARRVQQTAGLLEKLGNLHGRPATQVRDPLLGGLNRISKVSELATYRALAGEVQAIRSAADDLNSRP